MDANKIATKVFRGRSGHATPDPTLCAEGVARDWTYNQCSRSGVMEEGGYRWCRQHAPSAEDAREAKATAARQAEYDRTAKRYELDRLRGAILTVALAADTDTLPPDLRAAVEAYKAKA